MLLLVLVILTISVGGLVEIVPLFFQKSTTEAVAGMKPYSALQLTGRDIYLREGCYGCHSQMIRPFRAETERYGHYSVAGESVYDHPFQWGSKRTGPDLARVGGRYSDSWHKDHLNDPRSVVPESNMPSYSWLAKGKLDPASVAPKMRAMKTLGVPWMGWTVLALWRRAAKVPHAFQPRLRQLLLRAARQRRAVRMQAHVQRLGHQHRGA